MAEQIDQWLWWMAEDLLGERICDINALLPQLTDQAFELVTKDRLRETASGGWSVIATVYEDGKIRAMAELHAFTTTTERKGQIDNVVADENYRGRKFGEKLMRTLLDRAFGADHHPLDLVQLTSNPDNPNRYAARNLYKKLGFKEKYPGFFVIKRKEWLVLRDKLDTIDSNDQIG